MTSIELSAAAPSDIDGIMTPLEEDQLLPLPPAPILRLRIQELVVLICDMSGYRRSGGEGVP
jgi:hypothetical protein